jgi:hypothetical protein
MLDVPALKVRPVIVEKLIPLKLDNVTVLLPRLIVRVLVLLDDRDDAVTLKLLVVKVPAVTVSAPVTTKASCKVKVAVDAPPEPVASCPGIVFPAVVIEIAPDEAFMPNVDVAVNVMLAERVKLPAMLMLLEPAKVPVKPVKLRLLTFAVAVIVQVTTPDAASKNTSSELVGTL